jgi:hypothetical protein
MAHGGDVLGWKFDKVPMSQAEMTALRAHSAASEEKG